MKMLESYFFLGLHPLYLKLLEHCDYFNRDIFFHEGCVWMRDVNIVFPLFAFFFNSPNHSLALQRDGNVKGHSWFVCISLEHKIMQIHYFI